MRKFLKFVLLSALVLFVGVPVAFVLFVMVMAMFGVAIGIGSAILGLIWTVLKVALMIILPIVLLVWVAKRLLSPERTY
jgi:energy-coupling factor transporter transmembrane protein EcfT